MSSASDNSLPNLPASLHAERHGNVAILRLNRPHKRNALDDETIIGIDTFFTSLPDGIGAVLLHGEGEHFSAGLDLSELEERDVTQGIAHSGLWHRAFEKIQFGKVPTVVVLHGAVVGGGLELAAAAHVRIAEHSAYYALPEGSRGIYVGGGGSVRLPRLIGIARVTDMMLTGRTYSAEEGQTMGLSTYLVEPGKGYAKGREIVIRIAGNAPLTNFAVMHALPRIAEMDPASGYAAEALMSSIAQADGEAKTRLKDFLEKRAPKVTRPNMSLTTAPAPPPRASAPLRPVRLGKFDAVLERAQSGVIHIRTTQVLPPYHPNLSEPLEHWANAAPDRIFLAQRDAKDRWRTLSYAEVLGLAKRIGAALLRRGLSAERPIAIVSGNDIEHALLALAAIYVGIPYAPISPAYSLLSSDFGKLRAIIDLLTPGMVLADDGGPFARALYQTVPDDIELVVTRNPLGDRPTTLFADLLGAEDSGGVAAAHARVTPDTIAKFLFTSGSTGNPKAVINTHRMMCSNQAMIAAGFAFIVDEPPVVVDWLPWSHTFGSNHNFNMVLVNGGSLYIDDGNPTPPGVPKTVRNLREIAPTIYFNVPKGYEALIPHFRADKQLARNFFSRLKVLFYAGAGLNQTTWDDLTKLAIETTGERIIFLSSLGSTETAPLALACTWDFDRPGNIGLPAPGVELKLVPNEGKLEARLRGPHITPGYWRQDQLTREAFDDDGFYKLGDALKFVDPNDAGKGLLFDGRLAEDFKLSTGTWTSVGPLRARFIDHFAPYVRDVVLAGPDRDDIVALVIPDIEACRKLSGLAADATPAAVLGEPRLRAKFAELLTKLAAASRGTSTRVARTILMAEPPSMDKGEMTDKGSINQRAVLKNRAALVDELYATPLSSRAIAVADA